MHVSISHALNFKNSVSRIIKKLTAFLDMRTSLIRRARQLTNLSRYRVANGNFYGNINLSSEGSSFKAADLEIHKTKNPKKLPEFTGENLVFGTKSTDHMLTIDWEKTKGWSKPVISELKPISLHRFNSSLHYAIECFEGFKAYKNAKGEIRLFRPECNMFRLKNTSRALCLPDFDGNELLECVKKYVAFEERWVPAQRGFSLYLRPTHISMENTLGVKDPSAAQLFIVACPTGPYYPSGFKPVSLYCETERIRSAPKGYGTYKMGSNYAPTLLSSKKAQAMGYSQCLWLFEGQVVEVGASNIFFVMKDKNGKKELLTPELDGLILPGVTRDSILKHVAKKGTYKITERKIMIEEIIEALQSGKVQEIFGAGTAVIVSPVKGIGYKGKHYEVPYSEKLQAGELAHELFNQLLDIQEGTVDHPWTIRVK